ncbi:Mediator of RNA polymerase II transcription subunit [Lachnellula suecica]|uniref:Mediator of RNA polymerase II transcription subunit 31 n=1 Tax=Lachnellula suecica TaxID=602035 RepID=A0A8T9BR49_9HELO|nr:Mediator of RNA polymerase II transcription subunit [Lachnellula suecica]
MAGTQDISMSDRQTPPPVPSSEPKFGGFTRFEVELEFVQSLASPLYLNHLASLKYLENPAFVAYLSYLQYWSQPPYTKYLTYPGPTLKNLELLQQERFRADILGPDTVAVVDGGGCEGCGGVAE